MSVSVLIPAYNEEKTIKDVIEAVKECKMVDETIVIDDGSSDNTYKKVEETGVHLVRIPRNVGKGGALKRGIEESKGDIIVFLDADLLGLRPEHIEALIKPVMEGNAGMTVGIFKKGRKTTDLSQYLTPFLSGQRAIKRDLLSRFDKIEFTKYGIEVALTRYAKRENIKVEFVDLYDVTHLMKEEKRGFIRGFLERLKMYYQLLRQFFIKY